MRRIGMFGLTTAIALLPVSGALASIRVCNEFQTRIHVAFAYPENGGYTAAGWWPVAKGACQDIDSKIQGDTLYYTANSDTYKNGSRRSKDHWGNKVRLYLGKGKFNFTSAEKKRPGAKEEMFSSAAATTMRNSLKEPVMVLHFKSGGTTIELKP